MEWFKVWTGIRDDPDIRRLTDKEFRCWVYILDECAERETDGVYVTAGRAPMWLRGLVEKGRLIPLEDPGTYFVKGWDKRQVLKSDLETRRAKARAAADARWKAPRTPPPDAPSIAPNNAPSNAPEDTAELAEVKRLEVRGAEEPQQSPPTANANERPSHDTIHLAERINLAWQASTGKLTPAALQRFVKTHGGREVESCVRELYGFPPEEAVRSPYAYLEAMLRERLASA